MFSIRFVPRSFLLQDIYSDWLFRIFNMLTFSCAKVKSFSDLLQTRLFLLFFFLLCHVACGFFVLNPGNKCTWIHAHLVKVWSPNHWTARKVPRLFQDWEFQHYYLIKAITLFSVLHSLAFTYTHTYVEFQIKVRLKKWDSCIRGIVYFLIIKAS